MKNICVYCGSSSDVDDIYKEAAVELGKDMARQGIGLVYGGGHVGLMGLIADSVLENGGAAIGVIPEFIRAKEVQHDHLTEMHVVETMHERKMIMAERADGFVILPGGFGTMDEFFEILTWRQLNIHNKPIIVCNVNGYWSPLEAMIDNIVSSGFARDVHKGLFTVVDSVDQVLPAISDLYKGPSEIVWEKI